MTADFDEASIRHWLVDYLVTNIGCSPDEIDFDAPLNDLAVGSSDAVVLTGELSEMLGRTISPVEFWQYPTINSLAKFLTGGEVDAVAEAVPMKRGGMDEPIAVVGLGCRFPGDIDGPDALWQFLTEGRSAVGQVPSWRWESFDDGSAEATSALRKTTQWGSYLSGVDEFDAEYFEISPSEADKMDPQQRLLLEVTHEALEHAGIRPDALRHTQTGVFAGAGFGEYGVLASKDLSQVNAYSGTGGALSIIANRVSYYFDLRGPSVTIDTACSSSLVAIHLACQSLRTGDSDVALAAGVNLLLSPAPTLSFDQAEAMSPSGRCHSFDARADGFVRGEGCGVAVLKRLSDAERDGDRILAVVRGSAVNQDGRSNGLMAPNPAAQMAVLRSAYAAAGVEPRDVDYVEAHGTGTLLGDPIEARALGTVLGRGRRADAPLLIGAVKSNLGHTEAAAGIAGFAKTVLALQHGRVPANLDYQTPNPHIPFDKLRLKVVDEHTDLPSGRRPRVAGVSSFGFGGTNAHVVIEQAPAPVPAPAVESVGSPVTTLVVSGKSAQRIAAGAAAVAEWMTGPGAEESLPQVAHALNHHRSQHTKFATVCARTRDEAVAGLRALAEGESAPGVVGPLDKTRKPGRVFVYSGQGSQWAGMGRQLLAEEPAFAAAVAELEPVFVEQVGFSLHDVIAGGQDVTGIDRIQPVLVGIQLALTELWRSYGVHPDAVIGHSMGEVAAAVVAGGLSVADGLRVIATRSRLMARLSGQGAMALIELDADAAEELIADYSDVTVAVHASPRQTVIAGPPDQVDAVIAAVAAQDRLARRVEVDVASHHPTVDPILEELRAALQDLTPTEPVISIVTTTGGHDEADPVFNADYWVDNLRNPVRFSEAVTAAGADHGVFVEVSPHPLLTFGITDTVGTAHHRVVPTLLRDSDETLTFHTHANSTYTNQVPATPHVCGPRPMLPTTPWLHSRHWVPAAESEHRGVSAPSLGTLLGDRSAVATMPPTHVWQARLLPQAKPYPGFHRIQGVEIVPMSVLLQTLSVAAAGTGATTLADVRFERPVVVDQPQVIQVVATDDLLTVSSAPSANADAGRWVRHVTAHLNVSAPGDDASEPTTDHAVSNGTESGYNRSTVEELQARWGVEGQPFPWSIGAVRSVPGGLVADVETPEASRVALLDAAVQIARLADLSDERLMVPAGAESVSVSGAPVGDRATVTVRRRPEGGDDLLVDVTATEPGGDVRVDIRGLRYVDVQAGAAVSTSSTAAPQSVAHVIDWQPWTPDSADRAAGGVSAAVLGTGELAEALRQRLRDNEFDIVDAAAARCVLYVPDTEAAGPDESDLDCAIRLSGDVAELVGTLADRDEARLWIVTSGVRDAASAQALRQSCLWGIANVIGAEQPQVWGGLVDIADGADLDEAIRALAGVLPTPAKSILSLRGDDVFAPALAAVADAAEPVREPLRCRPDGAYLITGGMGALGLLTAQWLADRGARRVVLAGRTALPPRRQWASSELDRGVRAKIDAIRALEGRGVAVEIAPVDIGSGDAVSALLEQRDDAGAPPVRGVVHAAGLTDSQLLTDISEDRLRDTMWPKIAGAEVLDALFPPGSLDFFVLTASAGTVFGVPGQGAYAAANAYLDGLARARHGQGCPTVSLDWVAWQGLGFGSDAQVVVDELARLGSRPVTPTEAFAAWEYVSRFDVAHAVMAPMTSGDGATADTGAVTAPARDWSQLSAEEVYAGLEEGLRAIMAVELRIPQSDVDSDLPFAEMGLNSVMAMSIRREVEHLAGIELSATMLWNHPTIASLAAHLAEKVAPPAEDEDAGLEESSDSLLDSLFDSVETSAGTEGRM